MRQPLKSEALQKLRELRVPVGSVIDVGVLSGTEALIAAYGDCKHLLIEPVAEYAPRIARIYG